MTSLRVRSAEPTSTLGEGADAVIERGLERVDNADLAHCLTVLNLDGSSRTYTQRGIWPFFFRPYPSGAAVPPRSPACVSRGQVDKRSPLAYRRPKPDLKPRPINAQ